MARASRTCRCMSGSLTHGSGENVPGIPGACATRNFSYLARGTWYWFIPAAFHSSWISLPAKNTNIIKHRHLHSNIKRNPHTYVVTATFTRILCPFIREMSLHWLRKWLGVFSVPIIYVQQMTTYCQWNPKEQILEEMWISEQILFQDNAFQISVCKIIAIMIVPTERCQATLALRICRYIHKKWDV